MHKIKVSSRGAVTIPKAMRDAKGWQPGIEIVVLESGDGVSLKTVSTQPRYTVDDLANFPAYKGEPKTLEEMQAGINAAFRSDWKL